MSKTLVKFADYTIPSLAKFNYIGRQIYQCTEYKLLLNISKNKPIVIDNRRRRHTPHSELIKSSTGWLCCYTKYHWYPSTKHCDIGEMRLKDNTHASQSVHQAAIWRVIQIILRRTTRLQTSFFPQAVRLLNSSSTLPQKMGFACFLFLCSIRDYNCIFRNPVL